jgi:hypothetical protein
MSRARRGPAPLPGQASAIRIECVPKEGELFVRFLGNYVGVYTHYSKKGPIPCQGEDECPGAVHKTRKIWKGFAPAEYWRPAPYGDYFPCVFEITESLNERMDAIELRGTLWKLFRSPGIHGKPEVSGNQVERDDHDELRPAFDVKPTVQRLMGMLPIIWGVKSHIPPRLILAPSPGSPPPGVFNTRPKDSAKDAAAAAAERDRVRRILAEGRAAMGMPPRQESSNEPPHHANGNGKVVSQ